MTPLVLAAASAFWLGVLTSISPCPLATNIAAISFVGRRLENPRLVFLAGLLYTLGRALAYGVLGMLLVSSLLNAPVVAHLLQKYLNQVLGPLLIVMGMFLLELLSFGTRGGGGFAGLQERVARHGVWGALALGFLFALSFCPISAALFFGSLIPLAVAEESGVLLPAVYGIGTGLPVLVVAFVVALGARSIGTAFRKLSAFEKWARRVTGIVFVGAGIYLTLVVVFGVSSAAPEGPGRAAAAGSGAVHDPAHPPIDCPLRKHGIDPSSLKPFQEVEDYIAFLDRADRAAWQKPDEVVTALGLKGDETVVDVGAGSGYFTFRLAAALPRGKVIATDVEAEMVRHLHHQALTRAATNVEVVLAAGDDPGVPATADLVFVCDVLHHVPDRAAWLGKLFAELRPGARFALVEFREGPLPEGPPESVKIPRATLVKEIQAAGFERAEDRPEFLPYQSFLVFRKPPSR